MHQLKRLLQHKNLSLSSKRELEVFFHPYHEAFPEIHKLLRIFMTVPVTSGKTDGGAGGAAAPLAGHFEIFGPPVTTLLILLSDL